MSDISVAMMFDPICPWCYIGRRRLAEAISSSEHSIALHYLPFQLNPEMPEGGIDRRSYLSGKFGGDDQAKRAYAPIYATSEEMGLDMDLDSIEVTPNTMKAHAVLQYLQELGEGGDFGEVLLRAYLCEGRNIGDEAVLQELSGLASITEAVDSYGAFIMQAQQQAVQANVHGVPFCIVAGRFGVSGAQPAEAFLQVFDSVTENKS